MSNDGSLNELVHQLAEERLLDLRVYKPATLQRRVSKRMQQVGITSYAEYLERLRQDPRETNELLNVVLINVTEFFRDPEAWEVLREEVLPAMLSKMKPGDSFRAWSAGCASGEEPYSLAILVADYLGPKVADYDIKIYATDIDENALQVARRGEYEAKHLRRVRPEWRQRYFHGAVHLRINRELRRMIIFGCSNLVSDAPISHCHLVMCRNVLIYFDAVAQRQVITRLHYALEPAGVLFLGKNESKLSDSALFNPVNARWRIFQRADRDREAHGGKAPVAAAASPAEYERRLDPEVARLRLQHQFLLDTVRSGVIVLDDNDVVTGCNESAQRIWRIPGAQLVGKPVKTSDLAYRCPELSGQIEAAHSSNEAVQFRCNSRMNGEERSISVTLRSLTTESGERLGTIMHCEDVTSHGRLESTIEQLGATGEELQSANQELETTNEELQSTNEELETTNEELQSTNEELETTNEELQSLNEELENMNSELETRTRELNTLTGRYEETLRRMPWPVILVDRDLRIELWNAAAHKLFGVGANSVVGVELEKLPADISLVKDLVRRSRAVMVTNKIMTLRNQTLNVADGVTFDVQFTPASRSDTDVDGVLIMFGAFTGGTNRAGNHTPANGPGNGSRSKKHPAKAARK